MDRGRRAGRRGAGAGGVACASYPGGDALRKCVSASPGEVPADPDAMPPPQRVPLPVPGTVLRLVGEEDPEGFFKPLGSCVSEGKAG